MKDTQIAILLLIVVAAVGVFDALHHDFRRLALDISMALIALAFLTKGLRGLLLFLGGLLFCFSAYLWRFLW